MPTADGPWHSVGEVVRWLPPTACASSSRSARFILRRTPNTSAPNGGVTFYNLVADQYSGLHGIVVTGTLRDSRVLLRLLLGQQTLLQPREIMTDTGAYADVIFELLWLLGYQCSPRRSDIGGARLWRIDCTADDGPLNALAVNRI